MFDAAILEGDIIVNVISLDDNVNPKEFNAVPLSNGQGIGDKYIPPAPPVPESTIEERVDTLENTSATKESVQAIWDALAAAYQEGVNEA